MSEPTTHAADEPQDAAPRRVGVAVLVLAVVAAMLAVACVALALVTRSQRAARSDFLAARNAAASAAGQLVVDLDALSAGTIDADLKRVVGLSTGTFKKQFTSSQAQLRTVVVQQKISSKGELRSVGVVRSDTDTATVIVAVDRTFKDVTHTSGVVANDRWKVELEKHGGRWLVSDLEPVA